MEDETRRRVIRVMIAESWGRRTQVVSGRDRLRDMSGVQEHASANQN
jgi:hypothetical protein